MNQTYIAITIIYGTGKPMVNYYRNDGKQPFSSWDKLTVDEANILMWELIKLGGENSYESNWFDSKIYHRRVTFWGQL